MKILGKASILLIVAVFAVFFASSACKKEKKSGTDAANEFCDCMYKRDNNVEFGICTASWSTKYGNEVELKLKFDMEGNVDLESFKFKDEAFGKDFVAAIVKCEAWRKKKSGADAANDFCECLSKMSDETEFATCAGMWTLKYQSEVDFDLNFDDDGNVGINNFNFKDESFGNDFKATIINCNAWKDQN